MIQCHHITQIQIQNNFTGEGKTYVVPNASQGNQTFSPFILDHFFWSVHHEMPTQCKGTQVLLNHGKKLKSIKTEI